MVHERAAVAPHRTVVLFAAIYPVVGRVEAQRALCAVPVVLRHDRMGIAPEPEMSFPGCVLGRGVRGSVLRRLL